jgi:pyruvate/2-oxoacid:ferredoxin oxidoreductase alpha subunit
MLLGQQGELKDHNFKLQAKYDEIAKTEIRYEEYLTDDAELIVVAYGSASRIARAAIEELRGAGVKAGLFRPITLVSLSQRAAPRPGRRGPQGGGI